jgi:hypothetical protein
LRRLSYLPAEELGDLGPTSKSEVIHPCVPSVSSNSEWLNGDSASKSTTAKQTARPGMKKMVERIADDEKQCNPKKARTPSGRVTS